MVTDHEVRHALAVRTIRHRQRLSKLRGSRADGTGICCITSSGGGSGDECRAGGSSRGDEAEVFPRWRVGVKQLLHAELMAQQLPPQAIPIDT